MGEQARALKMDVNTFKQHMGYPTPHVALRTFDEVAGWARNHGMDIAINRERFTTKVGHHVDSDYYNAQAWLEGGYDLPLYDPLLKPRDTLLTGVWPLGTVPAVTYVRVTTYHAGYVQRGGGKDPHHNRWMREKDQFDLYLDAGDDHSSLIMPYDRNTGAMLPRFKKAYGRLENAADVGWRSTYWYGLDEAGRVISACNAADLFLDWTSFRGWIDDLRKLELGYWVHPKLKRGCHAGHREWTWVNAGKIDGTKPRRITPSALALVDALKSDTMVVALPGNYPEPPPVGLTTETGLIKAHKDGLITLAGVFPAPNVRTPMIPEQMTGLRVWPVTSAGGSSQGEQSWVFYYKGPRQVVGACPLSWYKLLAEKPGKGDKDFCNPADTPFWKDPAFLAVVGGTTSLLAMSIGVPPQVSSAAMSLTCSAMRGNTSSMLMAAGSMLAPAIATGFPAADQITSGAATGLATLLGAQTGDLDLRSLGEAALGTDFRAALGERLATTKGAEFLSLRGVDKIGPRLANVLAQAPNAGMPVGPARQVVGEQLNQYAAISRGVFKDEDPKSWIEAVNTYLSGNADTTREGRRHLYSGDNTMNLTAALRAGGRHPLERDPSVFAAALAGDLPVNVAGNMRVRRSQLPYASTSMLESAAKGYVEQISTAAREALKNVAARNSTMETGRAPPPSASSALIEATTALRRNTQPEGRGASRGGASIGVAASVVSAAALVALVVAGR